MGRSPVSIEARHPFVTSYSLLEDFPETSDHPLYLPCYRYPPVDPSTDALTSPRSLVGPPTVPLL